MRCSFCKDSAVYKDLCKNHFIGYLEDKVKKTIKDYRLILKKQKVAVAASGGKDSLSLLYMLHKFGYDVTALAIDEGIPNYRDKSLKTLKRFCTKNNIPIKIASFKKYVKKPLVEIVKTGERPCTVCGIFRRYLLNSNSKSYDVLATGHNLDDEAQAVIMNLMKNNMSQFSRQGPKSGKGKIKNFTKRVKPLYFCLEKEMMIYSYLNGLTDDFNECPFVSKSFRLKVRDYLNDVENDSPGTKENIVRWYLSNTKKVGMKKGNKFCRLCGENSSGEICSACLYMRKLCS